jgi:hypothetical protein
MDFRKDSHREMAILKGIDDEAEETRKLGWSVTDLYFDLPDPKGRMSW